MNDNSIIKNIIENSLSNDFYEISIMPTLINFFLCLILGFVLRYFYLHKSNSLNGKNNIASILPLLTGIIFLVIVIVKSSLALSLGLVGALSIVRFRTPIKEPEELVYLFFAIAIGLGFGANQPVITTIISVTMILIINTWYSFKGKNSSYNLEFNLLLSWKDKNILIDDLISKIRDKLTSIKIIRVDYSNESYSAMLIVEPNNNITLDQILIDLKKYNNEIECTFTESNINW
jgi:hypothetical protein